MAPKLIDYYDESGKKRRVTKAQYDTFMRRRRTRDEGTNAKAYQASMDRAASAGSGRRMNASQGSVGPEGSFARAGVAKGVNAPFNVGPGLLGTPGVSRRQPGPDQNAIDTWNAASAKAQPEAPDPLKELLDQLMAGIHTDAGAGPNLQDYIGGFGPARQNALQYQQAATGKIDAGTAALLQKLQATTNTGLANNADAQKQAQAQAGQVQNDQGAAAMKAAADLASQGVSTAPVEQAQQAIGGQLAAQTANSDQLAAKFAQLQASEGADRVNSANTMATGAKGTLGLNTNAQLNDLNMAEAQARRQYGQDAASHSAAAANAASGDIERKMQLAQQFAQLDSDTQEDPTAQVRQQHPQFGQMWSALDSGQTPSEARLEIQTGLAQEKSKDRAEQDHAAIARATEALKALSDWEKATAPDAKAAAKKRQVELLRHYLTGPTSK